ncbi:MAG: hypothetical protein ABI119_13745 [Gemmatimonadaceae bacterium]
MSNDAPDRITPEWLAGFERDVDAFKARRRLLGDEDGAGFAEVARGLARYALVLENANRSMVEAVERLTGRGAGKQFPAKPSGMVS